MIEALDMLLNGGTGGGGGGYPYDSFDVVLSAKTEVTLNGERYELLPLDGKTTLDAENYRDVAVELDVYMGKQIEFPPEFKGAFRLRAHPIGVTGSIAFLDAPNKTMYVADADLKKWIVKSTAVPCDDDARLMSTDNKNLMVLVKAGEYGDVNKVFTSWNQGVSWSSVFTNPPGLTGQGFYGQDSFDCNESGVMAGVTRDSAKTALNLVWSTNRGGTWSVLNITSLMNRFSTPMVRVMRNGHVLVMDGSTVLLFKNAPFTLANAVSIPWPENPLGGNVTPMGVYSSSDAKQGFIVAQLALYGWNGSAGVEGLSKLMDLQGYSAVADTGLGSAVITGGAGDVAILAWEGTTLTSYTIDNRQILPNSHYGYEISVIPGGAYDLDKIIVSGRNGNVDNRYPGFVLVTKGLLGYSFEMPDAKLGPYAKLLYRKKIEQPS